MPCLLTGSDTKLCLFPGSDVKLCLLHTNGRWPPKGAEWVEAQFKAAGMLPLLTDVKCLLVEAPFLVLS